MAKGQRVEIERGFFPKSHPFTKKEAMAKASTLRKQGHRVTLRRFSVKDSRGRIIGRGWYPDTSR